MAAPTSSFCISSDGFASARGLFIKAYKVLTNQNWRRLMEISIKNTMGQLESFVTV